MPDDRRAPAFVRHRYLVLIAVSAIVHLVFLGRRDLWYPNEPDIAEVTQAMFVGGDWLVPRRNGAPWIDYWPGLYWAASAAGHVLGRLDEFALRLPSALAALVLALQVCAIASRRFSPAAGAWSGILLMTFASFAYNAASHRPDVLFTLFASGGILAYATGAGERARWLPRVLGFAMLGCAVLVKGPLGLLLPGLVLTVWHVMRREWRRIVELAPLALVAVAVALPWALACAEATGAAWFWGEIHAQNFARFEAGARGHAQPPWYYLIGIWGELAPWSPLLPFALVWLWRSPLRGDRYAQLALCWLVTMLVFLSLATTKRQLYLLPAYPAIALVIGVWIGALGTAAQPRPARLFAKAVGVVVAGLGACTMLMALVQPLWLDVLRLEGPALAAALALRIPGVITGLVASSMGIWTARAAGDTAVERPLLRVATTAVALYALGAGLVAPAANPVKTYAPEGKWIAAQLEAGEDRFGLLFPKLGHHKIGGLGFYSGAAVVPLGDALEMTRFLARHPGSIVLVHEEIAEALFAHDRDRWAPRVVREVIAGRRRYFALRGDA